MATAHAAHVASIIDARGGDRAITAMLSGRRVVSPDNTTDIGLNWWHGVVGGRGKLHSSMMNSAWEGVTGSWTDTGITPPGHGATNYGDGRLHCNMCLSTEGANVLAESITEKHYVQTSETEFAARPRETRGVPWGFARGVYTRSWTALSAHSQQHGPCPDSMPTMRQTWSQNFSSSP